MWQQIKKLNEERGQILADMKVMLDKSETEKRDLTAEENGRFDELNAKAEAVKLKVEQYERAYNVEKDIEQRRREPGREPITDPNPTPKDKEQRTAEQQESEERSQFNRYLRGASPAELRALTVSGQGIVGTREFLNRLVVALKFYAGVRAAGAEILPTSTGNPIVIPTLTDTANTARQVAEATTNNNVTEPTLGTLQLDAFKFDSDWIKVSLEMIQDNQYDLEGKIVGLAAERIGRKLNTATTVGTGSSEINGFVTAASTGKTSAANTAIMYDELIDLEHSVDAAYRQTGRCQFMLHDLTLAAIRKLKDTSGQYIWKAGETGVPGRLMNYGYTVNNDMATLAANKKVVAFGDFSKYVVRDVATPQVIRANELFIGDGLIGFKVISRHDGDLTDTAAVKLLATPA